MFDTAAMDQLAARVRAKREAQGLGLNVGFVQSDGKTLDNYSFATKERADAFRARLTELGRTIVS